METKDTNYIRPDSSAHWYTASGEPRHDATLREARKEKLYPSVTTVLSAKSAPGLEAWKRNQLLIASLNLPEEIRAAKDADIAAQYIIAESGKKVEAAANRGTFVHDSIEKMFAGEEWDQNDPQLNAVDEWIRANVLDHKWSEEVLINKSIGFAGRADSLIDHQAKGLTLVDFKTQDVKKSRKGKWTPRYHDKYLFQLAAYGACLPERPNLLSLVINVNEPEVYERFWTEEEADEAWAVFQHIHAIWCHDKKFHPAKHEVEVSA